MVGKGQEGVLWYNPETWSVSYKCNLYSFLSQFQIYNCNILCLVVQRLASSQHHHITSSVYGDTTTRHMEQTFSWELFVCKWWILTNFMMSTSGTEANSSVAFCDNCQHKRWSSYCIVMCIITYIIRPLDRFREKSG